MCAWMRVRSDRRTQYVLQKSQGHNAHFGARRQAFACKLTSSGAADAAAAVASTAATASAASVVVDVASTAATIQNPEKCRVRSVFGDDGKGDGRQRSMTRRPEHIHIYCTNSHPDTLTRRLRGKIVPRSPLAVPSNIQQHAKAKQHRAAATAATVSASSPGRVVWAAAPRGKRENMYENCFKCLSA